MKPIFTHLLPLFILSLLISCGGRNFETDWQQATESYQTGSSTKDPVTGPWQGTWLSASSGHTGELRCLITPIEVSQGNGSYLFRYWATWAGPLQGGFDAAFEIEKMGTQYHVQGTQSLGAFGSFQHEGVIQGSHFEADYHSSTGDHGNFVLRRPPPQ
ncbi:MAG: hypothetical protein L3J39_10155 [Verrucomicrobiales bacterium]|nr:hypothetical protein [Verrucomicrobiales bacterium]